MTIKHVTSSCLALVLSTALVLPTLTSAEAGGGRKHWRQHGGNHQAHRPHRPRHHYKKKNNNDVGAAVAAGVIGLAAAAVIGSALSAPEPIDPDPVYVPPRPRGYGGPARADRYYDDYYDDYYDAPRDYRPARPVVVGRAGPEPWTREWYRYCSAKYRSFNPRTGQFTTYSGVKKLCR